MPRVMYKLVRLRDLRNRTLVHIQIMDKGNGDNYCNGCTNDSALCPGNFDNFLTRGPSYLDTLLERFRDLIPVLLQLEELGLRLLVTFQHSNGRSGLGTTLTLYEGDDAQILDCGEWLLTLKEEHPVSSFCYPFLLPD